ncbi:hypothetical protein [Legionella clemsonensis]|uniref:Uncharacterized protein n=1 Tax=Legionella clemsonensis TaxID=1867846 RepID=A0A222P4Z9_9GAMM|nr:hypothetical protein [Legionella clemsonensis]ASQ46893.1 hypothetical protein clem_11780 [Legionella clemsonensis]
MLNSITSNDKQAAFFADQIDVFKSALSEFDNQVVDKLWRDNNLQQLLCDGSVTLEDRQYSLSLDTVVDVFLIALKSPFHYISNSMWRRNFLQNALLLDFKTAKNFLPMILASLIHTENTGFATQYINLISDTALIEEAQMILIHKIYFSQPSKNRLKQEIFFSLEKRLNKLHAEKQTITYPSERQESSISVMTPAHVVDFVSPQPEATSQQHEEELFLTPEFSVALDFNYYRALSNQSFDEFFQDTPSITNTFTCLSELEQKLILRELIQFSSNQSLYQYIYCLDNIIPLIEARNHFKQDDQYHQQVEILRQRIDFLMNKTLHSDDLIFLIQVKDILDEEDIALKDALHKRISQLIEEGFLQADADLQENFFQAEAKMTAPVEIEKALNSLKEEKTLASFKHYCQTNRDFISTSIRGEIYLGDEQADENFFENFNYSP